MGYAEMVKSCPYCGFQDAFENFGKWEKDGKRGLLGKTSDGYIIFMCPKCEGHIKYDSLANSFLRMDAPAKSTSVVNNIVGWGVILLVIYLIDKLIMR